jgi:hypothetical protein
MAQINKPSEYFNTKLYTGNGSTQSITGVGFQPDWTWFKRRNGTDTHAVFDNVRGVQQRLIPNNTSAEGTQSNGLTSFDSDGFSIGDAGICNTSGGTYASWNWLANGAGVSNTDGTITSTVSANTTSGFSIVSYTGTGSAATVGHGLNAVPKMIITKRRNGGDSWSIYHTGIASDAETDVIYFETGAAFDNATFWNDTAPTSSVFSVGSASSANPFIAYCFAEKKGFSKFGKYTGNGSATDGTFVYTGFKPRFIMIKGTTLASSWVMFDTVRSTINPVPITGGFLLANVSNAEAGTGDSSAYIDILSNGFKIRNNSGFDNNSGDTYIYMAFAEHPLVGTNNIPTTAR